MRFLYLTFTVRISRDAPQETVGSQLARRSPGLPVAPMWHEPAVEPRRGLDRFAGAGEAREDIQPIAPPAGCRSSRGRDDLEKQASLSDARGSLPR
jgi:hypothetical protein